MFQKPNNTAQNMNIKPKPNICLITDPRPLAAVAPLSNLTDILFNLSNFFYLITGNEGERVFKTRSNLAGHSFYYKPNKFFLMRIVNHIMMQLKIKP